MPTISISSLPAVATQNLDERVSLEIYVRPEDWEGAFDVIEIWRSEQTEQGPFFELTAASWEEAMIPVDGGEPSSSVGRLADVVGKTLQLRVNENTDLVPVFVGVDILSATNLVSHMTFVSVAFGSPISPDGVYAQVRVEFLDTFPLGGAFPSRYRYTTDSGAHWSAPIDLLGSTVLVVHGVPVGLNMIMTPVVQTGDYFTFQTVSSGTAGDPIHLSFAASQIQAQGQNLLRSYVDPAGVLVLQTLEPGTGAALRVVGGEAAPLLGLPTEEPDSLAYGHDARIPLVHGQQLYAFVDLQGASENYYKTRFRNTQTDSVSEFSAPFSVKTTIGVSPANLIQGVLDLVGIDGLPLQNREVIVHNAYLGNVIENKAVVGGALSKMTDQIGHVEFMLVRGTQITVAISGTQIVRDVTVPTDLTVVSFNLLDPKLGTDDVFKVQVPNIEYASRRSL